MSYRFKRIFVIVADSVGIGAEPDADKYGDEGSNTLLHTAEAVGGLNIPTMNALGINDLCNIPGTFPVEHNSSFVTTAREESNGKDTMTGHWEMMGIYTTKPFKTFTDTGFPDDLIKLLEERTGHKVIGNCAASGTEIIKELGEEQMRDNSLIVYTSADSVLQIAAHEEATGLQELYRCCDIARDICMKEDWKVGRIIARPYVGSSPDSFKRTPNRHDIALKPPYPTAMNSLENANFTVSCIGKISDIFDGYGVTQTIKTKSNHEGMTFVTEQAKNFNFTGLCFVNLVEFDSEYGHRRNAEGYAKCLEEFDLDLATLMDCLNKDDLLIITADHGNDPTWSGTDHTRERVPLLMYSKSFTLGKKLNERASFADIGATILKNFKLEKPSYLIGKPINELFE